MTASEGSEQERVRRVARAQLFAEPPQVIADRYEIIAHVGRGGLGEVYRCRDLKLRRALAIKFVRAPRHRAMEEGELFREAIVLARISHPNIVPVYDVGSLADEVFLAMALVEGETLHEVLERGPMPWPIAVRLFVQLADALAAAHGEGVVHGDIKPHNVMVDREQRVRVLDFGLARELGSTAPTGDLGSTRPSGTLGYLAPERHEGILSPGTDQFSFGVALYRALWGQLPVAATDRPTAASLAEAVARRPPGRVPHWLVAIVRRALAFAAADRFASMAELRDALARRGGRVGLAGAGVALVVVASVAAWLGSDGTRCAQDDPGGAWSNDERARLLQRIPTAHAASVGTFVDEYAGARAVLRQSSCEALHAGAISGALHDLRHACVQRKDLALRHALDRASAPEFTAWSELPGALASLADLAPCSADAVLLDERPRDADPDVIAAVNRGIDVAYLELMLGNPVGYLEGLQQVEREQADFTRAPVESLWLAAHVGAALNLLGRHADAATRLRAALTQSQRHPRWRRIEGMLLVHLTESLASMRSAEATFFAEQAIATLEGAPDSEVFMPLAWRAVAVAKLTAGDAAAALEAIDAARRSSPPALHTHESAAERLHAAAIANLRGLALERLGEIAAAEREYRGGIASAADSPATNRVVAQLHNNLGLLLRDGQRYDDARTELASAAELKARLHDDDGHAVSLMNLANLELAAGNTERALSYYDDALGRASSDATIVGVRLNRGVALQEQTRWREAIADFDHVLAASPAAASPAHRWSAFLGRGQAWLGLGEKTRAREDLEAALLREPANPGAVARVDLRLALASLVEATQPDRALDLADEASSAARDTADPTLLARTRAWLGARGR